MQNSDKIFKKGVRVAMKKKYKHLTIEERDLIAVRNAEGIGQEEIAAEVSLQSQEKLRETNPQKEFILPQKQINKLKKENQKPIREQESLMNLQENILRTG